jgi:lysophospholipase L1-like esterase
MNLVADLALAAVAILLFLSVLWIVLFWVKHAKDDPTVWEREIRRLEKFDRISPPRPGAILFVGSSSFRYWQALAADMAPLNVLNRGFGGSQIHDCTYYVPRIVVPFQPRAIVFYAGENDVAGVLWSRQKSPEDVRLAFKKFCGATHAHLPKVPIYFISIKPPKARRKHWPTMQEANRLVRDYCDTDSRLHYINVVPALVDDGGNPLLDVFRWDGLHYNEKGYAVWTSIIKPIFSTSG